MLFIVSIASCDRYEKFQLPEVKLTESECIIPSGIRDVVDTHFISEIFGVEENSIILKQTDRRNSRLFSFILWDESIYENNKGIYLELRTNRDNDFEGNFTKEFIRVLKEVGETDLNGNKSLYTSWDMGSDGAYNVNSGTYAWQIHDCLLFKMTFNTSHTKKEQLHLATLLAHNMNKSYFSYLSLSVH